MEGADESTDPPSLLASCVAMSERIKTFFEIKIPFCGKIYSSFDATKFS